MITRCAHGHVCPVNAGRALHPMLLDVCEGGAMDERDSLTVPRDEHAHYMIRDGEWWICRNGCGWRHPFPGGYHAPDGPCVPRRWGDQAIVSGG